MDCFHSERQKRVVRWLWILCLFLWLSSVGAGPSPEEPAEEPAEGLQPDGEAGGQRLPLAHRCVLAQSDADHGCGRCQRADGPAANGWKTTCTVWQNWCVISKYMIRFWLWLVSPFFFFQSKWGFVTYTVIKANLNQKISLIKPSFWKLYMVLCLKL